MEAYERFHQRMVALNSPDLVDMSLTLAQLKAIYVVAAAGSLSMGALTERLGHRPVDDQRDRRSPRPARAAGARGGPG